MFYLCFPLSRTFQKGSINFSQIHPSIEITVASLEAIPEENKALSRLKSDFEEGGRFHFLPSDISVTERVLERASTVQVKYVTKLVENIHNRFDSVSPHSRYSIPWNFLQESQKNGLIMHWQR